MRLLKCPKCGEMFSDTYKTCPFCQEDEERHSDKPAKRVGRRTGGGRAKPKVGGGVVIACLVLVLGLAAFTIFGSQITAFFTGGKETPTPEPTVLTMSKTSVDLTVGSSISLTASGSDRVSFSSSDEAVATVSADGTVKAVGEGSAVITAAAEDSTATCRVTVTAAADQPDDPVTPDTPVTPSTPTTGAKDLKIYSVLGGNAVEDMTVEVGVETPMRVEGTESAVTWSMADTSVATVGSDGTVTGIAAGGMTTLTATVDGQTLTCIVRVG